MQQNQASPYKVENNKPKRVFKIQPNGDVIMEETLVTKVWFDGRNFISFVRGHESVIKKIEKDLSDETRKKALEEKAYIEKEVKRMSPMIEEVDKKVKADYEIKRKENLFHNLNALLKSDVADERAFLAFWGSMKDDWKKEFIKSLDEKSQKKFLKLKARSMRKSKR